MFLCQVQVLGLCEDRGENAEGEERGFHFSVAEKPTEEETTRDARVACVFPEGGKWPEVHTDCGPL